MAMIFTQTDTNRAICDTGLEKAACSGASTAPPGEPKISEVGATAGSTPGTYSLSSSVSGGGLFTVSCTIPASTTGSAGTWTTRLNITTANMNLTLTSVHICRVDSSCANQETIGSTTGLSISLGTTGVKSVDVTGIAVTLAAGDMVNIVWLANNGAMSTQGAGITPNQDIDSPFSVATMPEIDAQPGSLSVTGVAATLAAGRLFNAEPGSYAITGAAATLAKGFQVNAESGSYAVSGVDATLLKGSVISADAGSYAVSGAAATLAAGLMFNAETGSYSLSGADATFALGFVMSLDAGSYAISGVDTGLLAARMLNAEPGSLALTGVAATLEYGQVGAYEINAEPGSYGVTGASANLTAERMLSADSGIYAVSGVDATFERTIAGAFEINAEPGSYGLSGVDAEFEFTGVVPAVTEQPAGRKSRRRVERFIARYRDNEYEFESIDELRAFIESLGTRKPKVKVSVPESVREAFVALDLPSIETPLMRFDWPSAEKLWERYQLLRQFNPVADVASMNNRLLRQIEREDEELLLL